MLFRSNDLVLSHMGFYVRDLERMARFYKEVMCFTETDRGDLGAVQLIFLSRDPSEHHQVVLATGRAGLGGSWAPAWAHELPRTHWAHSADPHDYTALTGLRVGVVGAGASAMDSAATALEAGAQRVHLLIRRADIPRINKGKGAGNPGFVHGHAQLPDAWKWRVRHYINVQQVPPPRGSTLRVSQHDNAYFHLGCAVQGARCEGGVLQVSTSAGPIELDFLIFATGFSGHGFGIGPAAGRLAADLVAGASPVVDPHPFRYSRMVDGTRLVPDSGL